MFRFGSAAAVLLIAAITATAQQPSPIPTIGETIEVSIVNVDVVVTDRRGNRVRGLTKDDFVVYEGNVLQPVSNFAEYAAEPSGVAGVEGRAPEQQQAPRQKRTVVVFVEKMQLTPERAETFISSVRKLLAEVLEEGDRVAVVSWKGDVAFGLDYAADAAAADAALVALTPDVHGTLADPLSLFRQELIWKGYLPDPWKTTPYLARLSAQRALGGDVDAVNSAIPHAIASLAEMRRRVGAINATIHSMTAHEGKRILLLATRRLGEVAGAEFFYTAGAIEIPVEHRQRFATKELLDSVTANANAAGVTIYPIYPPGEGESTSDRAANTMPDPTVQARTLRNEKLALAKIAEKTGGLSAFNVADIAKLLPRVADDMSDYYSLAYRVTSARGDRARDIVVRTKNPAYVVRARRQFVEKSDETRMKDRVLATLFSDDPPAGFGIEADFGELRGQLLPLTIRIPIRSLTTLPKDDDKQAGVFSVFVAAAANVGRVSDVTRETQPFELTSAELARESHFTYTVQLRVDRKSERVAIGVLDEVSKAYALLRVSLPSP